MKTNLQLMRLMVLYRTAGRMRMLSPAAASEIRRLEDDLRLGIVIEIA